MFADAFQEIEHGNAAKLLDKVNTSLDGITFDPVSARILSHPLPFYPDCDLVEATEHEARPLKRVTFVIDNKTENVFILNGKNDPVYELNETVGLSLSQEDLPLYIRFFLNYVRGHYGFFHLVQSVNDIEWREEPTPNAQKALGKMIHPIQILGAHDKGGYHARCNIVFKQSLLETDLKITENGHVSFENQEIVVEDVPVSDDIFSL
jgi:hypothetical protein